MRAEPRGAAPAATGIGAGLGATSLGPSEDWASSDSSRLGLLSATTSDLSLAWGARTPW